MQVEVSMIPFAHGTLLRAARSAPRADIDALSGGGVLVLSPHPDDETLGCGGAIIEAIGRGHPVHVVTVTDGGASHRESGTWPRERLVARRRAELDRALEVLGGGRITHDWLGYPDRGAPAPGGPTGTALVTRLLAMMRGRALANLWTTWSGDPHVDHERCAALAVALQGRADEGGTTLRRFEFPIWGRFVETARLEPEIALLRLPVAHRRTAKARAPACHETHLAGRVHDDPDGYVMPDPMRRHFLAHDELFVDRIGASRGTTR